MYFPVIVGPDGSFRWFAHSTQKVCKKDEDGGPKLHFTYLYECIDFLSKNTNEQAVGAIYDQDRGIFLPKRVVGLRLEQDVRWYDVDAIKEKIKYKKIGG